MKTALAILLLISMGVNVWQRVTASEIIALQAEAIRLDKEYWDRVQKKPIFLWKDPQTGNIFVGVPYFEKPILFKGVCMKEQRL